MRFSLSIGKKEPSRSGHSMSEMPSTNNSSIPNSKASSDFIDNLQNIVTDYMKTSSYSVGISDLIANLETNEKISSAIIKKKQRCISTKQNKKITNILNNQAKKYNI